MIDYKRSTKKYKLWIGSPFQRTSLTLKQFVDALIHFVFLGNQSYTKINQKMGKNHKEKYPIQYYKKKPMWAYIRSV